MISQSAAVENAAASGLYTGVETSATSPKYSGADEADTKWQHAAVDEGITNDHPAAVDEAAINEQHSVADEDTEVGLTIGATFLGWGLIEVIRLKWWSGGWCFAIGILLTLCVLASRRATVVINHAFGIFVLCLLSYGCWSLFRYLYSLIPRL